MSILQGFTGAQCSTWPVPWCRKEQKKWQCSRLCVLLRVEPGTWSQISAMFLVSACTNVYQVRASERAALVVSFVPAGSPP